jgi:hypothetical protein
MLGPDTPDEFGDFDGWHPPTRHSQIEAFVENDANVLLGRAGGVWLIATAHPYDRVRWQRERE